MLSYVLSWSIHMGHKSWCPCVANICWPPSPSSCLLRNWGGCLSWASICQQSKTSLTRYTPQKSRLNMASGSAKAIHLSIYTSYMRSILRSNNAVLSTHSQLLGTTNRGSGMVPICLPICVTVQLSVKTRLGPVEHNSYATKTGGFPYSRSRLQCRHKSSDLADAAKWLQVGGFNRTCTYWLTNERFQAVFKASVSEDVMHWNHWLRFYDSMNTTLTSQSYVKKKDNAALGHLKPLPADEMACNNKLLKDDSAHCKLSSRWTLGDAHPLCIFMLWLPIGHHSPSSWEPSLPKFLDPLFHGISHVASTFQIFEKGSYLVIFQNNTCQFEA